MNTSHINNESSTSLRARFFKAVEDIKQGSDAVFLACEPEKVQSVRNYAGQAVIKLTIETCEGGCMVRSRVVNTSLSALIAGALDSLSEGSPYTELAIPGSSHTYARGIIGQQAKARGIRVRVKRRKGIVGIELRSSDLEEACRHLIERFVLGQKEPLELAYVAQVFAEQVARFAKATTQQIYDKTMSEYEPGEHDDDELL